MIRQEENNMVKNEHDENIEEKLIKYFQKRGIIKEQTIFDLIS